MYTYYYKVYLFACIHQSKIDSNCMPLNGHFLHQLLSDACIFVASIQLPSLSKFTFKLCDVGTYVHVMYYVTIGMPYGICYLAQTKLSNTLLLISFTP